MINILCLFPITANGGISSWSRKFLATFPDDIYSLTVIDSSPTTDRIGKNSRLGNRIVSGLKALKRIKRELIITLKEQRFDILHTTTSGSIGALRDLVVGRACHKYGLKTIMHCRYGCIPEDYHSAKLGMLLRASMKQYDQIWVLDKRTFAFLSAQKGMDGKVFLTPNSIEVNSELDAAPKTYSRVGFVGNLHPTKGIFELVQACANCDVRLDIIGPGSDEVVSKIKELAGDKYGDTIVAHGKLPNVEAVNFMNKIDIVALPTYYPWEAFPISILEAMSLSKMVLSCPRAAIPDMLEDLDGNMCGLLVEPHSSKAIKEAIIWCQEHKEQADTMRINAYHKVLTAYDTSVVYDIYRRNYDLLLSR